GECVSMANVAAEGEDFMARTPLHVFLPDPPSLPPSLSFGDEGQSNGRGKTASAL
ncbi:Hypothetical protein NocV09_06900100, partial [Nannochloropsis oceanica]